MNCIASLSSVRLPAFISLGLAFSVFLACRASALEITYDGNASQLADSVDFAGYPPKDDVLYPGTGTSPKGNGIVIDYSTGTDPAWVLGGLSGTETVSGNTVILIKGTVTEGLYGGYDDSLSASQASGNSIDISGGIVRGYASGGYSEYGNASDNTAVLRSGKVQYISGGESHAGTVSTNTLTVTGGEAYVASGGLSRGMAAVSGNTLVINGPSVQVSNAIGGTSESGAVSHNSLTIIDGIVSGMVLGGMSFSSVTNNTVIISGGTVLEMVYGGYSIKEAATNNTVIVSGNPNFGPVTVLAGGYSPTGDTFSGNTLKVSNYFGSDVSSIQQFEHYDFLLAADMTGGIVATGTVNLSNSHDPSQTAKIDRVDILNGGRIPLPGERVPLITADIINGIPSNYGDTLHGKRGALLDIVFRLDIETHTTAPDVLYAVLGQTGATPAAKAISEGFLAGAMLINQGADLVTGPGLVEASRAAERAGARADLAGGRGIGTFAAASGGRSRYATGSHADITAFAFMTGLSWSGDLSPGRLTLAAFFEYGKGSYGTFNSFTGSASARGDGDVRYAGGGIIGRMDFKESATGHFHAEASARAGSIRNEFRTSALTDPLGTSARGYDSTSGYFGMHLGLGYEFVLTDTTALDVYAKYFWTRQEGDSVVLATGDPVSFDDVDSHRVRLGARLSFKASEHVLPYVGAAYEREFDGRARASTYGFAIEAPSLAGGTGMGELGLSVCPSDVLPLSIDLGAQVFAGSRRGAAGSLTIKYAF
ncbi:MAG: autotransporter outer membrane beta-barrel domain-containing protein [Deltaproteobacteria bacterium]|jgi:hypothetical protein|nr:autotransporter outer membrane beta-barrel domain-containing protein [Deltaproteobacteria bacterium]